MTDAVHAKPDDRTLVRIRGLTTVLNGKTVFNALDLDIPRGKVTAIMGPTAPVKPPCSSTSPGKCAGMRARCAWTD